MGSKAIVLFLGFLVAMVLLISSEVAARDLAETTNAGETSKQTEATEAEPTQYGGGYRPPYGGYRPPYGGYRPPYGGYRPPYGGYRPPYGGGGGCRYGCCGRGYGRCRCCSYAGQAVDAGYEAETHN